MEIPNKRINNPLPIIRATAVTSPLNRLNRHNIILYNESGIVSLPHGSNGRGMMVVKAMRRGKKLGTVKAVSSLLSRQTALLSLRSFSNGIFWHLSKLCQRFHWKLWTWCPVIFAEGRGNDARAAVTRTSKLGSPGFPNSSTSSDWSARLCDGHNGRRCNYEDISSIFLSIEYMC